MNWNKLKEGCKNVKKNLYTILNSEGKYEKLEGLNQNIFLKEELLHPHNLIMSIIIDYKY